MFNKVTIIPTGDEIKDGIVLDTDSPMLMTALLSINGGSKITRLAPVIDAENVIMDIIQESATTSDLIVLIGGSGGGHRYSPTLGKDYTHSSLEQLLTNKFSQQMYGKNGHMWCKLVIGFLGNCLVINVPGPFEEAKVAIEAFKIAYENDESNLEEINKSMMEAVKGKYGF